MVNCEIEYYENGGTFDVFGNVKILVDFNKNHFDR